MPQETLELAAAIFAAAKCGTADREAYIREWNAFRALIFGPGVAPVLVRENNKAA